MLFKFLDIPFFFFHIIRKPDQMYWRDSFVHSPSTFPRGKSLSLIHISRRLSVCYAWFRYLDGDTPNFFLKT